ncbi:MAG: glycosyltransferase family 4 protein [Desulforhopalus sp.]|nr:glycosyltransferase family 4 protein [Desulforhopalus sp.]
MSDAIPCGLHILITNNTLGARAGSEVYARDLAIELMKRGHHPVVYSTVLGEVAEDLRRATVPVVDDLHALGTTPDIIHGQHHLETMTAALHFPRTPVISICHGWLPWEELPPLFPSILRYVAVDDLCKERLLTTKGVPPERVEVLYNFVDTDRFQLRPPLPARPQSALIFSNYAGASMVATLESACRKFGITRIDVAGIGMGKALTAPEEVLGDYDVVFAKAKCAIEASASGCALIVADFAGLGGMVTTENVESLRRLNFGVRTMQRAGVSEESVIVELQRYNAEDARQVSLLVRDKASMTKAVDRWDQLYREVLADWLTLAGGDQQAFAHNQLRAAAGYLSLLAPSLKTRYDGFARADHTERIVAEKEALLALVEARASAAEGRAAETEAQIRTNNETARQLANELQQIYTSRAWKLVTRYRIFKSGIANCRRAIAGKKL